MALLEVISSVPSLFSILKIQTLLTTYQHFEVGFAVLRMSIIESSTIDYIENGKWKIGVTGEIPLLSWPLHAFKKSLLSEANHRSPLSAFVPDIRIHAGIRACPKEKAVSKWSGSTLDA